MAKSDDAKHSVCSDVEIFGNVVVGAKGQIVIPNEVRKQLNIVAGDNLIVTVKHGKAIGLIKSTDLESFVAMMQEEIKKIKN